MRPPQFHIFYRDVWRSRELEKFSIGNMDVIFDHGGRSDWGKYSFPVFYGVPVIVKWRRHEFHFNQLGHVRRVYVRARYWPNAQETLKRTIAGDWVFMSTFGYESSYDLMKSHYVPLTAYHDPGIVLMDEHPLDSAYAAKAMDTFDALVARAGERAAEGVDGRAGRFLKKIAAHGRPALAKFTERLHALTGGPLPVLPPDTIDVEYEVLPVMIADGCTGGCTFCKFVDKLHFRVRDEKNVRAQIEGLRDMFKDDLINYNAVVLGQNDALAAGADAIDYAARLAYKELQITGSYHDGSSLFMFGGAHTLLEAPESLFATLNKLPFDNIYINVGLESAHRPTLDELGKPQTGRDVRRAFRLLQRLNLEYDALNVSCNFLIGDGLPPEHTESVRALLASAETRMSKGTAFISPIEGQSTHRRTRSEFTKIKLAAKMPVYLYLVQRL